MKMITQIKAKLIPQITTMSRMNRRNQLKIREITPTPNGHQHRVAIGCGGQYTLEWAVMMSAAVIAAMLMRHYVRDAMRANIKSTEMQLNGAMHDNRPVP